VDPTGKFFIIDDLIGAVIHYYQSWILGPLYLFVIGIPSGIHAAMHNTDKCNRCNELRENGDNDPYKHFWTEQWAEKYNKEKNKEEEKK
jgi:hypothetical protein